MSEAFQRQSVASTDIGGLRKAQTQKYCIKKEYPARLITSMSKVKSKSEIEDESDVSTGFDPPFEREATVISKRQE